MDEDNPDYLVHEIFTQNFFKDHPLGKPILGTKETVKRFERAPVVDAYAHRFAPGNIIVSAAGNLDHDRFVELVTKHFEHMKPTTNGFHSSAPRRLRGSSYATRKLWNKCSSAWACPRIPSRTKNATPAIFSTLCSAEA